MRKQLCSAWTVTLHYQTLRALDEALSRVGEEQRAIEFRREAAEILSDFRRLLINQGTIAGFALFGDQISYMLHPEDKTTGIRYSLLPMIHAIINDMLSPDQAAHHLEIIKLNLLGPDGARLFDKPFEYRGGTERLFQRAESSSFFGREIGLMYTHAHLRYAEALAHMGEASEFHKMLALVNPISVRSLVPSANRRQSNCYYSSSDATFLDRYEAFAKYGRVKTAAVNFDGGWRVYSSGAGINVGLIVRRFLGLGVEHRLLCIDPIVPKELDGLRVALHLLGKPLEVLYQVKERGAGPIAVSLNGTSLAFSRRPNPYRLGAVELEMPDFLSRWQNSKNILEIILS
jgi:cellobiose phosphorylase